MGYPATNYPILLGFSAIASNSEKKLFILLFFESLEGDVIKSTIFLIFVTPIKGQDLSTMKLISLNVGVLLSLLGNSYSL